MAKQQNTKDLFKAIEANDIKRAFSILAAHKNDIDYTYQHKGKTLLMFLCSRYITFSLASDNAGCKNYEEYRDKMISFLNLLILSARENNALNIADKNGKTTLMYLTEKISYVEDPSFIHAISSQIKNGGWKYNEFDENKNSFLDYSSIWRYEPQLLVNSGILENIPDAEIFADDGLLQSVFRKKDADTLDIFLKILDEKQDNVEKLPLTLDDINEWSHHFVAKYRDDMNVAKLGALRSVGVLVVAVLSIAALQILFAPQIVIIAAPAIALLSVFVLSLSSFIPAASMFFSSSNKLPLQQAKKIALYNGFEMNSAKDYTDVLVVSKTANKGVQSKETVSSAKYGSSSLQVGAKGAAKAPKNER